MRSTHRADLHVHTINSDGAHTAQELIDRSAKSLCLLSFCDHDTFGAYSSDLVLPKTMRLLPGIEMSCQVGDSDLHMLAYFPKGLTGEILSWGQLLETDRKERVLNGVSQLRESGVPLLWKDFEAETGSSVPCRSHVARALIRGGLCDSAGQAFRQWLRQGIFRRPQITAEEAFQQVHELDGLTYWAHPQADQIRTHGERLIKAGLDGVESLYKNLGTPHRKVAREFQETNELGACGGSDLHRESPRFKIGQFAVDTRRLDARL
ncbi:MAG: hypothetical protein P8K66_05050 [Planctomycetota bacterium]|nr:hypothetical protein [Planctomycetota bacterium]